MDPAVHGPVQLGDVGLTDRLARHLCTDIYILCHGAGQSLEVRPASQTVSYIKCNGFKSWAEVMTTCKITGMPRTLRIKMRYPYNLFEILPTNGQLVIAQSDHWIFGQSTVQSLNCGTQHCLTIGLFRAQRDSIRRQTLHSKRTAFDITKYQTFLTKYDIVCPLKRTFVNSRETAYHILQYPLF